MQLNGLVMADMYSEKERGKSLAMITLLPFLGPALGPILGGLVTQVLHYSWVFWIMSALNALIFVLGFVLIRESYTPVLLRRKAFKDAKTERARIAKNLTRPLQIFVRRPIIWLNSLTATLSFGIYTLVPGTYATL